MKLSTEAHGNAGPAMREAGFHLARARFAHPQDTPNIPCPRAGLSAHPLQSNWACAGEREEQVSNKLLPHKSSQDQGHFFFFGAEASTQS
eukprot:2631184-Rhodomonas_salina.1